MRLRYRPIPRIQGVLCPVWLSRHYCWPIILISCTLPLSDRTRMAGASSARSFTLLSSQRPPSGSVMNNTDFSILAPLMKSLAAGLTWQFSSRSSRPGMSRVNGPVFCSTGGLAASAWTGPSCCAGAVFVAAAFVADFGALGALAWLLDGASM